MDTVTLEPAADFEQRMQQLDALDLSTAGPALASQWPAGDLAHIEREENAAYIRYLQHAQTFVSASVKQLNSTQTFTLRETFLKTVGLISDEEQWTMLQARQENASEALAQGERKEARLCAEHDLWESRLNKLQQLLGANPDNRPAVAG